MNKNIMKRKTTDLMKLPPENEREILNPVSQTSPFFSFHYSYQEISSANGVTHVKSKKKSFANGKLTAEEFTGTMPGDVFAPAAREMQKNIFQQINSVWQSFPLVTLFGGKDK